MVLTGSFAGHTHFKSGVAVRASCAVQPPEPKRRLTIAKRKHLQTSRASMFNMRSSQMYNSCLKFTFFVFSTRSTLISRAAYTWLCM